MQVTGPGTLSFTLATGATGNLAGVMVKVDDKEQRLLNKIAWIRDIASPFRQAVTRSVGWVTTTPEAPAAHWPDLAM